MKRYVILIISILLLSGCSINYNLKISDKKLTENIKFSIDKSKIVNGENETFIDLSTGVYNYSYVSDFINRNDSALVSDKSKIYKKKVDETSNFYNIDMSYTYLMNQFNDASLLTTCFDSPLIIEDKNTYYIHLMGRFSCIYDEQSKVDINITSYNLVYKNNADKHFLNKYTWTIDWNNKDDIDIEIKVAKQNIFMYIIIRVLVIVFFIGVIIFIRNGYKMWKKRNDVNDI